MRSILFAEQCIWSFPESERYTRCFAAKMADTSWNRLGRLLKKNDPVLGLCEEISSWYILFIVLKFLSKNWSKNLNESILFPI